MKLPTAIIVATLLVFVAGGVFILNKEKEITIQNVPVQQEQTPPVTEAVSTTTAESLSREELIKKSEELITQAQAVILEAQKFIVEERAKSAGVAEAREKSSSVKGIYIGGTRSVNHFKTLLDETELNGLVIDVKEAYGQNLTPSLKSLLSEFRENGNWLIARIVVFRDSSLLETNPAWYLTSTSSNATTSLPWQDEAKQYWLDPQNQEVRNYIIEFSKEVIDYGFDELQFDYIRYPDDYSSITGPEKMKTIGDFFLELSQALRNYKPSIILSADLFGYLATQFNSLDIGQRLIDAGKCFDYLSFMLYPSHFYGGFSAGYDAARGLPVLSFPYNATDTATVVSNNPYPVILRSVLASVDYLSAYGLGAKVRPWLQDFNLNYDMTRGILYDVEKIKVQIQGAEDGGASGWLLWNPSYIYTRDALE